MGNTKTTFNNLITHWIIPHILLPQMHDFYDTVLIGPDKLQLFMKSLTEKYIIKVENDPDIESIFASEPFEIVFYGELERGVICVKIPNCEKHLDCIAIAFPSVREKAGYYTCEYSNSPLIDREFFVVGEWKMADGELMHNNWGELNGANLEAFAEQVYKISYKD